MRGVGRYPNMPPNVTCISQYIPSSTKGIISNRLATITRGKLVLSKNEALMVNEITKADFIVHAPGGPSIGDTYLDAEKTYLRIFDLILGMKKKYMFYAPSMGPFNNAQRNKWRMRILNNAEAIVVRDPISAQYLKSLGLKKEVFQALDSALQSDINIEQNQIKLSKYNDLSQFLARYKRCIGITITDLKWHPVLSKDVNIGMAIKSSFERFLVYLKENGYGIIFIPQLYGTGNDYDLMEAYGKNLENSFILQSNNNDYDAYFQQYLISQLYAVVGMRYHSNIFSAKMETPFISVSYEQKMEGFMQKIGLSDYCIKVQDLRDDLLINKFIALCENYDDLKVFLKKKHSIMRQESKRTSDILFDVLNREGLVNNCD
jgi:colanic acid/amylovoran biosynthesis protein